MNRKIIFILVLLVCLISVISAFFYKFGGISGLLPAGKAGLSVKSFFGQDTVILNGALVGKTPYYSDTLKPGEYSLSVKTDNYSYDTKIKIIPRALTSVVRDTGIGGVFSSGQTFWMESVSKRANGISIVSNPTDATVKLDSQDLGKTPLVKESIAEGEHNLEISKEGYETQTISINVKNGFKLNVIVDLFFVPIPKNIPTLDSGISNIKVYNFALAALPTSIDSSVWTKALYYWDKTRGLPMKITYYVDTEGTVYNYMGEKVDTLAGLLVDKEANIGYLALAANEALNEKAVASISALTGKAALGNFSVKIIPTGVGWLRVRKEPTLTSDEVAKINVGDTVTVLEEKEGWYKITLTSGEQGWISAQYTVKAETP